jgi:hypothetical protein
MNILCQLCGNPFKPKQNTKKLFCSFDCSRFAWSLNKKVTRICKKCGIDFTLFKSYEKSKGRESKYCSKNHADLDRYSKRKFEISWFRFDVKEYCYRSPSDQLGVYSGIRISRNPKFLYNEESFRMGIIDELLAYCYGILLTDGYITLERKGNRFYEKVDLKLTDRDIVEKVNQSLSSNQPIKDQSNGKYSRTYRITFSSPKLFNDLVALGCDSEKTAKANYPLIPFELDRHFIRGVFDGDGSWTTRRDGKEENIKFHGSEKLLYGIYEKIKHHLGFEPQKIDYPIDYNKSYKLKTYCVMKYGKLASYEIRDWLYHSANIFGNRKFRTAYMNEH